MAVTVSAVSDAAAAGVFPISQHNTQIKCSLSTGAQFPAQRPTDSLLSGSLKVAGVCVCVCTTCFLQKTTTKQPVIVRDSRVNENMRLLMD